MGRGSGIPDVLVTAGPTGRCVMLSASLNRFSGFWRNAPVLSCRRPSGAPFSGWRNQPARNARTTIIPLIHNQRLCLYSPEFSGNVDFYGVLCYKHSSYPSFCLRKRTFFLSFFPIPSLRLWRYVFSLVTVRLFCGYVRVCELTN